MPVWADLSATLRTYQSQGVAWLAFLRRAGLGALLAADMGLGETLQALCALDGPSLVVVPTSVVHNWAAETARFRPSLKVSLYHGPDRALDAKADLTVTSYALLRRDVEKLAPIAWNAVALAGRYLSLHSSGTGGRSGAGSSSEECRRALAGRIEAARGSRARRGCGCAGEGLRSR